MAAPREISLEAVRDFMLDKGGRVTNQDLVRHFKYVLTDPYTKGERISRDIARQIASTMACKQACFARFGLLNSGRDAEWSHFLHVRQPV